jgi:tripartite-type tricarboxylate transporter receptor subunit TctC
MLGRSCHALCGIVFAVAAHSAAQAQTWPSKPIRVVVPFSAGSATDIIARAVFDQVSAQVGQPVVVDNRVGAGGTIGATAVAKADADGYTILVHSSTHAVAPAMYSSLQYDAKRDFAAVMPLANLPNVLVAAQGKGYKTPRDLVNAAKANPNTMNYASAGVGSAAHLNAERFRLSADFSATHVPFKGGPEALREIVAGRVDFYFCPIPPALPLIKDGQVAALAVSGSNRASALPDLPTTIEAGYPNSEFNFWVGMFVPAATPREVVNRLHAETKKALEVAVVKERLTRLGAEPMVMTPEQFDAHVAKDIDANAQLVKAAGIKIN